MNKEIKRLLDTLCVDWGFCIPPKEADLISSLKQIEANEFASRVLEAEGMNPEYEVSWHRKIKNRFIEKFGNEFNVENE